MQSSSATGKPASPSGSCRSELTARIGSLLDRTTWNDREAWENTLGTAVSRGEVKLDDKSVTTGTEFRSCIDKCSQLDGARVIDLALEAIGRTAAKSGTHRA
jgi:hypothetical protein